MVTRTPRKVTRFATSAQQLAGRAGEEQALAHLLAMGLRLVERNFRTKWGEIDLIIQDGETIVFVEVRKRSRSHFGGAAASVTAAKQSRMIAAARIYLARHRPTSPCRFDVIAIDGDSMEWLKNAVEAS